jgi:hypothetical protein
MSASRPACVKNRYRCRCQPASELSAADEAAANLPDLMKCCNKLRKQVLDELMGGACGTGRALGN